MSDDQNLNIKYPTNIPEVKELLKAHIEEDISEADYKIHDDYSVSVYRNVTIQSVSTPHPKRHSKKLPMSYLPINFRKVNGNFTCKNLGLTTLKGCPIEVIGDFNFSENKITSLEFMPKHVRGVLRGCDNKITEVNCLPEKILSLDLANNKIKEFNLKNHKFPYLEIVDLSYNNLNTLNQSFDSALNIKMLDLNNNNFRHRMENLQFLDKLTKLEHLDVSDNSLSEIHLKNNKKLLHLYLSNNFFKNKFKIDCPELVILVAKNNHRIDMKHLIKSIDTKKCLLLTDVKNINGNDLIQLIQDKEQFYAEHLFEINNMYCSHNLKDDYRTEIIDAIQKKQIIMESL